MIETTGLADPAPVIQSLLVDEQCKLHLRLDSVLTVVDSKHITMHLPIPGTRGKDNTSSCGNATASSEQQKPSEAALQIAFADRVLLNKMDLVNADELSQVKYLVASVNPEAEIITCRNSEVDLHKILNIRTFDPNEFKKTMVTTSDKLGESPTVLSSSGYSFLPKNSSGKIDLKKSGFTGLKGGQSVGTGVTVTPARLGVGHLAVADMVCTISLTLPHAEPLDLNRFNT